MSTYREKFGNNKGGNCWRGPYGHLLRDEAMAGTGRPPRAAGVAVAGGG